MDILVTYDISTEDLAGTRRLTKVAAICERYGQRAQYSVFECQISEPNLVRLMAELAGVIQASTDSINFYRLQGGIQACKTAMGRKEVHALGRPWMA